MDPVRYRQLNFEPLKEKELPILYSWLLKSHVREFYHKKPVPCWHDMRAEYIQRLDPNWSTKCFLAAVGKPVGFIQVYRIADYPEYAAMIQESEGISVDLLIGDTDYLGSGWGRLLLLKFLDEVAFSLFPSENVCWIYHDLLNQRAHRASRAAGFNPVRNFKEEGDLKELLVVHRGQVAALAAPLRT